MSANPYIQFLKLSQTLTQKELSNELDMTTIKLMEMIVVNHSKNTSLTVSEAMALASMGSPATMHRKIDILRKQGWIDLLHEGEDRRTKYLSPTARTTKYFDSLSKLMAKVWSKSQAHG